MKYPFFIFYILLNLISSAHAPEAVAEKTNARFRQTLLENHLLKKKNQALRFLVKVPLMLTEDRVENYDVVSGKNFLSTHAMEDSINATLNSLYLSHGIECYFVLMEYFDMKISARPPPGWTIDSLFGNNSFATGSRIVDSLQKFQKKVGAYFRNALGNTLSRPVYVITIARYNTVLYSGDQASYYLSLHFRHQPSSAPLPHCFNEIYSDLLARMGRVNSYGASLNSDHLALTYVQTLRESAVKATIHKKILQTFRCDSLKAILRQFDPGDIDYASLTVPERLHCLSLLTGENMYGGTPQEPGGEEYAVYISRSPPPEQAHAFFTGLKAPSVLNNNPAYQGDKNNTDPLLQRLISGIDGDNYSLFIKGLTTVSHIRPDIQERISSIASEGGLNNKVFIWNEGWLVGTPPAGHTHYLAGFGENGKIRITVRRVEGVITSTSSSGNVPVSSIVYTNCPEILLDPFDLVLFVSNSDLPAFAEAGADKGMPLLVPAVFLKYAADKQFNHDAITAAAFAGDLITLGAAPLQLVKAVGWARRAWLAFETATALGNISINVLGNDLPQEYQEAVGYSNLLMAAVGGKNILAGGYHSFNAALLGTRELGNKISRELAQKLARSLAGTDASGQTLIQKLRTLSPSNASAKAITAFYEKVKQVYKDAFKKDLELDLAPFPSYLPEWVRDVKSVEDYLGKIPEAFRYKIKSAFKQGSINLKIPEEDIVLIRHISENGILKSGWYADEILSPTQARKLLALPNENNAKYIVRVKIRKGTPFLEGEVASQTNDPLFGPYATGGGKQLYFLKDFYSNDEIMQIIEGPFLNPLL